MTVSLGGATPPSEPGCWGFVSAPITVYVFFCFCAPFFTCCGGTLRLREGEQKWERDCEQGRCWTAQTALMLCELISSAHSSPSWCRNDIYQVSQQDLYQPYIARCEQHNPSIPCAVRMEGPGAIWKPRRRQCQAALA